MPVTVLVQALANVKLTITVVRTGHPRPGHQGSPAPGRTGGDTLPLAGQARLETADGDLAAGVFLLWLPFRLVEGTRRALDAAAEPAGVILGRLPGGMRREQRRAGATNVIDEVTGEDASVMSRAVLVTGGRAVGTRGGELDGRVREGPGLIMPGRLVRKEYCRATLRRQVDQ